MSKSESPMFKLGFENRKAVLGAEHVEKSWAAADDFNRPMQELVTEYCWGAIWGRDDLPRKTRSLLNIAMLTALNRPHELKAHVNGAVRNGVLASSAIFSATRRAHAGCDPSPVPTAVPPRASSSRPARASSILASAIPS